jgi:predicted SprT family Zn-dependent metalloprotease
MVNVSGNNINNYSQLEYRRKWLHQLQSEFKQICSWHRISLAVPAFRISDSPATLGSWHPETRMISISSALINEYSWDAVINVLKHEMAHQYVHEYLGRGLEQPHGQSFGEACKKLGVLFPFNAATGDTPKAFVAAQQYDRDSEYDKKVSKVQKMLSLAGSGNKHEAAAAMGKANSFIRKYNLERLGSHESPRYSYEIINIRKKRLHSIERRIAGLLMDYFYVDIVYSELFDPGSGESFKTIELLGTRENVAFARHVFDFLSHRVEFLWENYRKTDKAPGKLRKTYILGLLQGFREKLEKEEKKQTASTGISAGIGRHRTISALVVAKDPGLSEFTTHRFPRLRKVQYRATGIYSASTYAAGKSEGKKITIHKTVKHEDGNLGRLLGHK